MARFMNGDNEALGLLYERLHEPLYCFLYRYTREEQLSVDLVHDTFEIIQTKKDSYDVNRGTVKAFLFQIAYRRMMNKLNRRKRLQTLLPFLVPTPQKVQHDDALAVQQAIADLPEKQRAVILLAYYEDLPQEDIAHILSIPVGTVKSRLHNAMKALKLALKEEL